MPDTTEPVDVDALDENTRFLIWSNEHRMWWGPAERGYTGLIEEAGRYTLNHAMRICRQATVDGLLHLSVTSGLTGERIDVLPEHLVLAPLVLDAATATTDTIQEDAR